MPGEREEPRQLQAESLFAAWASRVESGEGLDFEDLVRANAELEPELRALHEDWKHFAPILGNVVPGLIASGDGLVLPSLTRGPDVDEEPPSDELLEKLGLHAPDTKRYRFRGRIGTGGQGVVLKVWDAKLSRPLAMKIVLGRAEDQPTGQAPRVDGRRLTRFVDEARIASQLNHPGIVPVHELGADESGRAFFTMKLVKGDDLSRIFEKVKRGEDGIGLPRAVSYLLRVCEAMAYAHDRGVIHRDLKPANVMVGAYGEVHVMDWGLARVIGDAASDGAAPRARPTEPISQVDSVRRAERDTTPGSVLATEHGEWIGTPCYMSPEQARGDNAAVGPQSDVYAVGAMLYQLLTGTPPYVPPGETVSGLIVLRQTIHGPPPPVESLAPRAIPELVAICERAMVRDPAARYASIRALAADLQAFLDGYVVSAYETGAWAETRKWVKRNKTISVSLGAAVLSICLSSLAVAVNAQQLKIAQVESEAKNRLLQEARAAAELRGIELNSQKCAAEEKAYLASIYGADAALKAGEYVRWRESLALAPSRLRHWEWWHLSAVDSSLLTLEHGGPVPSARFSPDGRQVVTASDDHSATVWSSETGEQQARLEGHSSSVLCAHFSPDGARVVTASGDRTVRVWDARSGRELLRLDGHTGPVSVASFSCDGTRIITASQDQTARVWDGTSGTELVRLVGHSTGIASASFSPDGARVATASGLRLLPGSSDGKQARVWDADCGRELAQLVGHTQAVLALCFSSDGARIVTASADGTARVWCADTGEEQLRLEGHTQRVLTACFSPDGTHIVTASDDGTARVWCADTGEEQFRLEGHAERVLTACFSPDGTRVVTASDDDTARVWDASFGNELAKLEGHIEDVRSAVFSQDGTRIVTASLDGTARVWNSNAVNRLTNLEGHAGGASMASISPDGTRIVTGAAHSFNAIVWDSDLGVRLARLEGHKGTVVAASYSPDGTRVVTASSDHSACVWDANTGDMIVSFGEHEDHLTSASFSPDGRRVVTTSLDKTARVWDASTGSEIVKLESAGGWMQSAAFSPDGTCVATGNLAGVACLWDAASGAELTEFKGHVADVQSVAFSSDGTRIVTTSVDRTARIWDAKSGAEVLVCKGHQGPVFSACFSPDGKRVVTASQDKTARVWDAGAGTELCKLEKHAGAVRTAVFSLDGRRIVTASYDGVVRIWESAPHRDRYRISVARAFARAAGESATNAALSRAGDFRMAAVDLLQDRSLDALVRQVALDSVLVRAQSERDRAH